jgi:hypothetical protein
MLTLSGCRLYIRAIAWGSYMGTLVARAAAAASPGLTGKASTSPVCGRYVSTMEFAGTRVGTNCTNGQTLLDARKPTGTWHTKASGSEDRHFCHCGISEPQLKDEGGSRDLRWLLKR